MTKSIFIAASEANSGKSVIALGLVNMLLGKTQKIAYFKPIINKPLSDKKDTHIETIVSFFNLDLDYEDTYAFSRQEATQRIEAHQGEVIDTIISKYKKLEENYDFTVIEGTDYQGEGIAFEFEENV